MVYVCYYAPRFHCGLSLHALVKDNNFSTFLQTQTHASKTSLIVACLICVLYYFWRHESHYGLSPKASARSYTRIVFWSQIVDWTLASYLRRTNLRNILDIKYFLERALFLFIRAVGDVMCRARGWNCEHNAWAYRQSHIPAQVLRRLGKIGF